MSTDEQAIRDRVTLWHMPPRKETSILFSVLWSRMSSFWLRANQLLRAAVLSSRDCEPYLLNLGSNLLETSRRSESLGTLPIVGPILPSGLSRLQGARRRSAQAVRCPFFASSQTVHGSWCATPTCCPQERDPRLDDMDGWWTYKKYRPPC